MPLDQRKRRLSFGVRAILLQFAIVAVALWVYLYGWQMLRWYIDQRAFVDAASQLKAGTLISERWRPTLTSYGPPWVSENGWHDAKGQFQRFLACRWPNALYIVYWEYEDSTCSSVEVFKLPPPPPGYVAQLETSRRAPSRGVFGGRSARPRPAGMTLEKYREAISPVDLAYKLDFVKMIEGDRKDVMGFEYEVIHSDRMPNRLVDEAEDKSAGPAIGTRQRGR